MRKQILFVQGGGERVHDTWDNKLVRSLERELGEEYVVLYPRMPNEADPRYSIWKTTLLNEFDNLEDGAILVGHSLGGTFLIHVLAEHPPKRKFSAIALIAAPFIGEAGWPSDDITSRTDFAERLPANVPLFLYHGTADDIAPPTHMELYAKLLPRAVVRSLAGRNHQLNDDLSDVARDIRALGIDTPQASRSGKPASDEQDREVKRRRTPPVRRK
jgi:predicted alpha/beta hydrolase family esterase